MAAALWRARSEGEVEEGYAGAQEREGERASGALGSSGQGRVSCELHARRGRAQLGGGYAGTTGLTARAREQRERGERRRARERRLR